MRLKIFIAVLVLIGHAGGGGSSVWAVAGETVKDIEAVRLNPWQVTSSARNFTEVEIVPGGQLSLAEISTLPRAPGSDVQVLAGPGRVKVQLPAEQVQALVDAGAGVTVLRRFLQFEGSTTDAKIPELDPIPQETCSGDYLYGYSDLDVPIPTDGGWDGSGIILSGVSPDAEVTCVDMHYEINHHYYSALLVELTDEDYDSAHTLYDDYYTGDGDISETEHGITKFNGRSPNQEWVLWAQNGGPMYGGHIDSWWIKVYYYEPFYCSATSTYCSWEYISNVQVGDISNATDCNYYGDYTSMSTAMDVGTGHPITVTNGQPYDENDECGIWVDWNQDGDFNDVSETISVVGSPGVGPYTATITPPPTAANGDTRMRIRITDEPAGPCGEYDYGEVEDYTISVTGGAMGQIHGRKFHDINGNGTQDANEPGLEGWEIYIDVNENGQHDIGEPNAITDSIGYYELLDLAAGTYTVAEVLQVDWDQTFPGGDGTHTVVLSSGDLAENINFGNRIPSGYGGGSGTANDPYLIYTPSQMNAIGANPNDWDKHFRLMADIDLGGYTGTSYNIIGYYISYSDNKPFTGVFDGNDNTIRNFTYDSNGVHHIGLFGYVTGLFGADGEIRDLGLIDTEVDAGTGSYVGSLVGRLGFYGTLSGCYVEGGSVDGNDVVGGLVGGNASIYYAPSGKMINCYAASVVHGDEAVGGLVGKNSHGIIINSYSTGSVIGSNSVGGLVGNNHSIDAVGGPLIVNCYSTGSVTGDSNVGGLVGENLCWDMSIFSSYSAGSVSGTSDVGGLVGSGAEEFAINSFWDVNSTSIDTSAGGTGKTTPQMQVPNTFMEAGWDFAGQPDGPSDIWAEPVGGGYPILWWQVSPLAALPSFSGGSGEVNDPYLISTASQLNSIGYNPRLMRAHFRLINDIDLRGVGFYIIGKELFPFRGAFQGGGHEVWNFTYRSTGVDDIGLFGAIEGENAWIKDLGLIEPNIGAGTDAYGVGALVGTLGGIVSDCYVEGGSVSGYGGVGGLVGIVGPGYGLLLLSAGEVMNCHSTASVSGHSGVGGLVGENNNNISNCHATGSAWGQFSIGGLVGNNDHGTISESCSSGEISGYFDAGGLVGFNSHGTISRCYSTGSVTGDAIGAGGLVSTNFGTISNCYATGGVLGDRRVGGLVGANFEVISNCYSVGSVSGNEAVGGLVGHVYSSPVTRNSFWDTQTSGQARSKGGTPKTTTQMYDPNTFLDAGWDFVGETINGPDDIWDICGGTGYPKFIWQVPVGDFACPDGVDGIDLGVLCEEWLLEELSADVWPEGGDGFVNFLDWAIFADGWQITVDYETLADFAEQWLKRGATIADIAPDGGDGIVNMEDFAALADNWLAGI